MRYFQVMSILERVLIAGVAALHILFLALEMFLWTKPLGRKVFRRTLEQARQSAVLAANQGLYNGFLAAGLFWAIVHSDPAIGRQLGIFFLGCVIVAGLFGGATASKAILLVQALPAAVALAVVLS
jgi:putative membrane protein